MSDEDIIKFYETYDNIQQDHGPASGIADDDNIYVDYQTTEKAIYAATYKDPCVAVDVVHVGEKIVEGD